jgi:hypothetical protein
MVKQQLEGFAMQKREAVDVMVSDFTNRSKAVAHEVKEKVESVAVSSKEKLTEADKAVIHWTPAACLVAGTAGVLITLKGMFHRGMYGGVLSTIGLGLISKSFADTERVMNQLLPAQVGEEETEAHKEPASNGGKAASHKPRARASVH